MRWVVLFPIFRWGNWGSERCWGRAGAQEKGPGPAPMRTVPQPASDCCPHCPSKVSATCLYCSPKVVGGCPWTEAQAWHECEELGSLHTAGGYANRCHLWKRKLSIWSKGPFTPLLGACSKEVNPKARNSSVHQALHWSLLYYNDDTDNNGHF